MWQLLSDEVKSFPDLIPELAHSKVRKNQLFSTVSLLLEKDSRTMTMGLEAFPLDAVREPTGREKKEIRVTVSQGSWWTSISFSVLLNTSNSFFHTHY